jgi:hypothetical protein
LEFLENLARNAETEEDIPLSIRNRPILNQYQILYWRAYMELADSRQYTSAGVASIPYTVKIAWLDENEVFDQDERNDYLGMIFLLDAAYLEHYYEKTKVT